MSNRIPSSSETWYGKTVVLPASPGNDDAPSQVVALWMTAPGGVVVHSSCEPHRKGPVRLVTSFADAVQSPVAGAPRVPRRIIVEDRQAADQLARLWKLVPVVRPIPEVDETLQALLRVFRPAENGAALVRLRPTPKDMLELQVAAAAMWKARPWEWLMGRNYLLIDAAGDPLGGRAISVLGVFGDVFGFALFDTEEDASCFWEAADREPNVSPTGCKYTFVAIEGPERLTTAEERQPAPPELGKRRCQVLRYVNEPPPEPTTGDDVRIACRVARALASIPRGQSDHEVDGLRIRPAAAASATFAGPSAGLKHADGTDLIAVEETYETGDRDRVVAWLDAAPGFERESSDGMLAWTWLRDGTDSATERSIAHLGQLVLYDHGLVVNTFSLANADALAETLKGSPALGFKGREVSPFKRF